MRLATDCRAAPRLKRIGVTLVLIGVCGAVLLGGTPARAQLLNQLQNSMGSGQGSGSGGLGSLGGLGGGVPSVNNASPTNLAGIIQYCIRNNYLSGGAASSVKDSLLGKVTGSRQGSTDSGFSSGNRGLLETGQGQSFGLGGGGIKSQVTRKVCSLVLQRAKSML